MRPSLISTQAPARLALRDAAVALALYAVAVGLRLSIRDAMPYTAEASHYFAARHLWHGSANIASIYPDVPHDDFSWFFWQRPLLSLLYAPAAALGFGAYRVAHILVASSLAPLGFLLLRRLGTPATYAGSAAAVLALHPGLVPWTTLLLPDATVGVLVLVALHAAHSGRATTTALVLLAAAWVKETAFVAAGALLVVSVVRDAMAWRDVAQGNRPRLPRPGPFTWRLALVVPLAFLPLYVSLHLPGVAFPGFRLGGTWAETVERLFLLVWLAPVAMLGLVPKRVRGLAVCALAWPAFFLLYHEVTGKAVEAWYNVVPATMTVLAAAAGLGALHDRWAAARAVGILVLALVAVQVAVPMSSATNAALTTPFGRTGQWDLQETLAYEHARDADLREAVTYLHSVPGLANGTLVALDMDWSLVYYPLADLAARVDKDYTLDLHYTPDALRWWADGIANRTQAMILHDGPHEFNQQLRTAYADCSHTFGVYTVIRASECGGHEARLVALAHA